MKILIGIIIIIVLGILAFILSPKPIARMIKGLFEGGMAVKPEDYEEIKERTIMFRDISYNLKYDDGYMDIILSKDSKEKFPVIFWVHGGAFVGGDKKDITEYGVQVAEKGYAVVNINYGLAPRYKYPNPLLQLEEAYRYIYVNSDKYNIDINKIYFAGDSAGAHIAGQFVNAQVDEEYRNLIGLKKTVERKNIKGAILLCGPYELDSFKDIKNRAANFIIKGIGWAYIGDRNWIESEKTKELSILDHISKNFPATFITDGNFLSFEEQGLALRDKLRKYNIKVVDAFYIKSQELVHNYQFMMDLEESKFTFKKLINFLEETKNF